jgi:hypothetical protein
MQMNVHSVGWHKVPTTKFSPVIDGVVYKMKLGSNLHKPLLSEAYSRQRKQRATTIPTNSKPRTTQTHTSPYCPKTKQNKNTLN